MLPASCVPEVPILEAPGALPGWTSGNQDMQVVFLGDEQDLVSSMQETFGVMLAEVGAVSPVLASQGQSSALSPRPGKQPSRGA